jgi:hypothetical protein
MEMTDTKTDAERFCALRPATGAAEKIVATRVNDNLQ